MHFRSGGVFSDIFIADFLQNVLVKNVDYQSMFSKDMAKNLVPCYCTYTNTEYSVSIRCSRPFLYIDDPSLGIGS